MRALVPATAVLLLLADGVRGEDPQPVFAADFAVDAAGFRFLDPANWARRAVEGRGGVLETAAGIGATAAAKYAPPFRSPRHIALVDGVVMSDLVLDVQARSTVKDYGHRDLCLVFGFRDPAHFYYVHLGLHHDKSSHNILIVDGAARRPLPTTVPHTKGTPWDDRWHHLRLVRTPADGRIAVYFDDMEKPVLSAVDTTFATGLVGVGSFDDQGQFDDLRLSGTRVAGGEPGQRP